MTISVMCLLLLLLVEVDGADLMEERTTLQVSRVQSRELVNPRGLNRKGRGEKW